MTMELQHINAKTVPPCTGCCDYNKILEVQDLLPKLSHIDYFIEPGLVELAARERSEPGYCSRVKDFVVGRKGHGSVTFLGETDVRWLDLDRLVAFGMHEVTVYTDERMKPPVGQGLNKPAVVTLRNIKCTKKHSGELVHQGLELERFEEKLKQKTREQGADYISYDATHHEWRFWVQHFSRFGLDDSDEEEPGHGTSTALPSMHEIMSEDIDATDMEEAIDKDAIWQVERSDVGSDEREANGSPMQESRVGAPQTALAHSLPLHLRLDPLKMQQMRTLFFPSGGEGDDIGMPKALDQPFQPSDRVLSPGRAVKPRKNYPPSKRESPGESPFSKHLMKISPQASWKPSPPVDVSTYNRQLSVEISQDGSPAKHPRMLLSLEGKSEQSALKKSRIGFKEEANTSSCMVGRSDNIVDAALFMGRSFRVGWGPHGLLAHSGNRVRTEGSMISSAIHLEKVALDGCVKDEEGKVRDELIELQFISPLTTHMSMSTVAEGIDEQSSKLRLRFLVCDRLQLPSACNMFEELMVKQHAFEGLSAPQRLVLRHQVMVWHLLSVLFSEKHENQSMKDLEEMDVSTPNVEPELTALVRRAQCSSWLQDSVRHVVQEEIGKLETVDQLKELFTLMTGRQLDDAVQLAVARGDVRLACLISQAGGSMELRKDIACQLETWEEEGLDFSLIERDRIQLYKLLAGDIQGALVGRKIDWKRFLGLLMWYCLPPDTHLADLIEAYNLLLQKGVAPQPIPMYVEEGGLHDIPRINERGHFDTAYYLMLLHAGQCQSAADICRMFSSFSSTYDPLDHRMAWLQHGFLQAIQVIKPMQLHILDMNFASQLLSVGQCHWAIYVVLHMPQNLEYPRLHEKVVKEILNQYCEVWSTSELQRSFLEDQLGIPSEWLHEALGTYWQFRGELLKAVKHLIKSMHWQRAHSLFMKSVAASLFVTGQHEELLELIKPLENNKMEIDSWDVSGGVYGDFFALKNSFHGDETVDMLESFESRMTACNAFFQRLKESRSLWESRCAPDNRLAYSRMADELATLLLTRSKAEVCAGAADLNLHYILMDAPVPDDVRFCRLQEAASSFTSWLLETPSR